MAHSTTKWSTDGCNHKNVLNHQYLVSLLCLSITQVCHVIKRCQAFLKFLSVSKTKRRFWQCWRCAVCRLLKLPHDLRYLRQCTPVLLRELFWRVPFLVSNVPRANTAGRRISKRVECPERLYCFADDRRSVDAKRHNNLDHYHKSSRWSWGCSRWYSTLCAPRSE